MGRTFQPAGIRYPLNSTSLIAFLWTNLTRFPQRRVSFITLGVNCICL
nr:hypothetical protein Iba_chr05aCG4250 [Ipomoea batatas]GMC97416.1 hypothetical protein Iba_chr05dCG6790 [Ipomoea batatas]GMD01259.1 hypothetical protein Iba_chr05fCG5730 [Ipomoea batatas]